MIIGLWSCQSNRLDIQVDDYPIDTQVKHFDEALFLSDTLQWESSYEELKQEYTAFFVGEDDPQLWLERRTDPFLNQLFEASQGNKSELKQQVDMLFEGIRHYYHYYPARKVSEIFFYVSGLDLDYPVIFADTMLFIASDMYMNADHPAYEGVQQFVRRDFRPEMMVSDVFLEMARFHIPFNPQNKSLLNRMIYEGKRLYFAQAMLPKRQLNTWMGYNEEEWTWAQNNEDFTWAYLINNQLLFSNKQEALSRFIEPAPFTKFFTNRDQETPGRLGTYMGWQIVSAFMENNSDVSLLEMLRITDPQQLLNQSNYKPKK